MDQSNSWKDDEGWEYRRIKALCKNPTKFYCNGTDADFRDAGKGEHIEPTEEWLEIKDEMQRKGWQFRGIDHQDYGIFARLIATPKSKEQ